MATIQQANSDNSASFSLTPDISPFQQQWNVLVEDNETNSFSYYLKDAFPQEQLDRWFEELHPSNFVANNNAWTDAQYKGEPLLRKTAWVVLQDECICEYGYSDTWQSIATSPKFRQTISGISKAVQKVTGDRSINCCNLNYYPRGGGVGFHADDESLFDGAHQNIRIISLSLCGRTGGSRTFQIRPSNIDNGSHQQHEIVLGHGDLLTMEGMFQKYYHHSVWPGDRMDFVDHPCTQGERINLTWRTIVRHLDGSEQCKGIKCPLSSLER
eukprot:CAMPEP_0178912320 /NCGR_PEP_ID=MMETSP0786-20121207/10196_1 /TAXON_ID=186022 /ORGANISM="Thalassionema frauenfeldii, Strain CCMP 1798" /LENGTH=269 /DNA_ID=CAMNT_0020584887 /DNA_START=67 /DNA_END=876 /DNA_ORIENTATION=+